MAKPKPPLDVYDLAVRLELDGITDAVAFNEYGYRSTLMMAKAHLANCKQPQKYSAKPKPSWVLFLATSVAK